MRSRDRVFYAIKKESADMRPPLDSLEKRAPVGRPRFAKRFDLKFSKIRLYTRESKKERRKTAVTRLPCDEQTTRVYALGRGITHADIYIYISIK